MYEAYQEWASRTYGDSAKTKTVTKKKYNRIVKILRGEESSNVENSKFRFWVKAKGFKLGPIEPDGSQSKDSITTSKEQVLYVPSCKVAGSSSASKSMARGDASLSTSEYKRVAVVENFYHIIYSVHVEMDGRSGKHAGQKRTYRAVAEMYAFLPREAVTRFLMSCSDCQKRMHLQPTATATATAVTPAKPKPTLKKRQPVSGAGNAQNGNGRPKYQHTDIDFSLPITTTYLKRMKSLGYHDTSDLLNFEDQISNGHSVNGSPLLFGSSSSPGEGEDEEEEGEEDQEGGEDQEEESNEGEVVSETGSDPIGEGGERNGTTDGIATEHDSRDSQQPATHETVTRTELNGEAAQNEESSKVGRRGRQKLKSMTNRGGEQIEAAGTREGEQRNSLPFNGSLDLTRNGDKSWNESQSRSCGMKRKREDSSLSDCERGSKDDLIIAGLDEDGDQESVDRDVGDDDDDDDDEGPGRGMSTNCDIERLKAFNMFVRLFVDENLDRMVPISRQPKEKVQAIIDSCNRQFPEFIERSRKRVRTYLKSCRRTRRHKLSPPKETTASQAQGVSNGESAAITCAQLPVTGSSYHLSSPLAEQILANACDNEYHNAKRMRVGLKPISVDDLSDGEDPEDLSLGSFAPPTVPIVTETPITNHVPSKTSGLTGVSSGVAVQVLKASSSAHTSSSSLLAALCQQRRLENESKASNLVNGSSNGTTKGILSGFDGNMTAKTVPPSIYSLNPGEMAAVKQLISGYRESAAFLLRSADELEHLLFQQPN